MNVDEIELFTVARYVAWTVVLTDAIDSSMRRTSRWQEAFWLPKPWVEAATSAMALSLAAIAATSPTKL